MILKPICASLHAQQASFYHGGLADAFMSESGTKRQFARCKAMSGVGGKADLPAERPDFSV
jgi:hypothetical protein